jgi:hypothetical protein
MQAVSGAAIAGKVSFGSHPEGFHHQDGRLVEGHTIKEVHEQHEEGVHTWEHGRCKACSYAPGSLSAGFVGFADKLYEHVTSTDTFEYFFQSCIGAMCVLMGLETYDAYEGNSTLETLVLVLIILFSSEVLLKMLAESLKPWRYFLGPDGAWNTMDLIIVVISIPGLPMGESGRLLRMLRLLRLAKIVGKLDRFRVFVCGLQDARGDIINVSALIIFILYLYSIAGKVLLGGDDPWHFGTLHDSFVTLFTMTTLDGWSMILYKNYYGCVSYTDDVAQGALDSKVYACPDDATAASNNSALTAAVFTLSFVTVTVSAHNMVTFDSHLTFYNSHP